MPVDNSRARSDIVLLHNIGLTAEVERLTVLLQERNSEGRLRRLVAIVEDEWLRGGWVGRRRFLLRALRSLAFRLFRLKVLHNLAPPPATARPHDVLPAQYARLTDALRAWRRTGIAESQRTAADAGPAGNNVHRAAHATWDGFVAARSDYPYLARLAPHGGGWGNLRVLVLLGGGGLGDALLFSVVLAALARRLAPCDIVLFYEKNVVVPIYAGNATIACAVAGPWGELQDAATAARWLGIFDLVVDAYCFLPRYLVCERSRIDMDRHGAWLVGNYQLGDLIERFSSNLGLSLLDRACNMHVFDLLAAITGLPLDASSPLVFSPDPAALSSVRKFALPDRYVTIRDGSNPGDLALARSLGVQRTTKQLPTAKWAEIIGVLRKLGLAVVQVGDNSDPPAVDVDIDLRGRTRLSELCFVMKGAVTHIDTEGGLAHFARAVNVPAVVCFGTTSATFFGYPSNLNLVSAACGRCWYSNATWIAHCPRGTEGPVCTASIDVEPLRQHLPALIAARGRAPAVLVDRELFADQDIETSAPAPSLTTWGLDLARRWAARYLGDDPALRIGVVSSSPEGDAGLGIVHLTPAPDDDAPLFGSIYNMPVNDGAYDAIVCVDVLAAAIEPAAALADLLRLVGLNGLLVIVTALAAEPPDGSLASSPPDLTTLAALLDAAGGEVPCLLPRQSRAVPRPYGVFSDCRATPAIGRQLPGHAWHCGLRLLSKLRLTRVAGSIRQLHPNWHSRAFQCRWL